MGNVLENTQLAFFKLGYNFVNNLLQTWKNWIVV